MNVCLVVLELLYK